MKKLFLLIPALVLALVTNAANVTNIDNGTPDALRLALHYASDGDVIVMAGGVYEESNSNYIAFDAKNVTVKAADGANVIIKPHVPLTVSGGARAEIQGVKIDASELCSLDSYSHLMYATDDADNNRLILDGCEIYGYTVGKAVIACRSSYKLDSLIINNCKFYNHTTRSCVFLENTENKGLIVTNSTFYNIATGTESFGAGIIDDRNPAAKVRVDHCTFYNVVAQNTDYAAVGKIAISDGIVSNCIFAMPTSTDNLRAIRGVAQANNCLTYNYTYDSNWGIHSSVTKTNCIQQQDPLFADAANGDFTLYNASPARGKATDNADLGDPRWAKAITPISIPATLLPLDAMLSDSAGIISATPDSIEFKVRGNRSYTNLEWAQWKVTATKDGQYNFIAHTQRSKSTGSQKFEIAFLNEDETEVIPTRQDNSMANIDTIQTGIVTLETGKTYIIKLRNIYNWAESKLIFVEANYLGGTTIAIPDTLWPEDAIRSEYAQLIHGDVDTLTFARPDHEWEAIDAEYTVDGSQYVKWNINIAKDGKYKFSANTYCKQGHNYRIMLLNADETSTIYSKQEADGTGSDYHNEGTDWQVATDLIDLVAGNYVLKMQGKSYGRVMYVAASYEGGAVANIPGQILATDALLKAETGGTLKMIHNSDGDIEYKSHANQLEEYAIWNIHATEAGEMVVTIHATGENGGHEYTLELYEGNTLKGSAVEDAGTKWNKTDFDFTNHLIIPAAGDYTLKLTNNVQYSVAILHGITFTPYVAPAAVTIDENATDNSAWIDYKDGAPVNVQFIRTLTAGMYNTFCAPFAISSSLCKTAFGSDVEIYTLKEAIVEGDILNVELKSETSIYQGTPVFIKPSADVVNPSFEGVSIVKETPAATTKTNANLVGTFIKTELEANPDILFLGPNNTLYFPEQTTPIKGLRAWFVVHDVPGGSHMIRHARIVQNEQVVTAIELVNQKPIDTIKVVENGQIIIVRDGIRYNTLGARVK